MQNAEPLHRTLDLPVSNLSAMMDSRLADLVDGSIDASRRQAGADVGGWTLLVVIAFCLATVLQFAAYRSAAPALVASVFLTLGYLAFHTSYPWGGRAERAAFSIIFAVCYFWSGIAAIYSVYLGDLGQQSDTAWFYRLATELDDGLSLDELRHITSGSGAVYLWRVIYRLFSAIGFEKGIYIAVAANTFLVSAAGAIAIKIVALIFGNDRRRLRRLTLLFASCGACWLFASVLLRDSAILLLNTLLLCVWVRYLVQPRWKTAVWLVLFSILATVLYAYLRTEFFFVPAALLLAGLASFIVVSGPLFRMPRTMGAAGGALLMMACVLVVVALLGGGESIVRYLGVVASGSRQYSEYAVSLDSNGSSLGVTYVLNQPLLIRLALGAFYLQIFPIPFWSGFIEGGAYHFFKSCNAIFMWFVMPLAILGLYRTWLLKLQCSKLALMFLCISYAGFTLAVAGTSLETRHLGVFCVPLLIVATVPSLDSKADIAVYLNFLGAWGALNVLIHLAWAALKLV